jgi:acyl carrier protein
MERTELITRLTEVFKKTFNKDTLILTDELNANDVDNWDSLTHMLLITEIEKTFSVKFKLKDLNKMRNVGDMVEIITSKL